MRYSFLTMMAVWLAVSLTGGASGQDFKLELSAEKSDFLLGEPVVVLVKVTNTGNTTMTIPGGLSPEMETLVYEISGPGGERLPYSPLYVADTDKSITLNRNESAHGAARIFYGGNGYAFPEAGAYKVTVRYKAERSAPLSLNIIAPRNAAEEKQARLILENNEVGLFLMLEGGDELAKAQEVTDTMLRDYPGSLLSAYLRYARGKNYSVPARNFVSQKPREADLSRAVELLTPLQDSGIQMFYRLKGATTLSRCLQQSGRSPEAVKVLEDLQGRLRGQPRLQPYFAPEISAQLQKLR